MKKKVLVCVVAVLVFTFALVACAPTTAPASEAPASEAPASEAAATPAPASADPEAKPLKIGYIITFGAHEWYANQVKGSKMTAEELGYDLIVVDAQNDQATQISQGENLLTQEVQAMIMAPVDGVGAMPLIENAMGKGVKVITTSVVAPKQDVYVGVDDFEGGYQEGLFAGQYQIDNNRGEEPKCLLVGLPALPACVNRTEGFKKGFSEKVPGATYVEVDGGGNKDTTLPVATDALTANPDTTVIMGINDDSTLGAVQAYKSLGYDVTKMVAWGFGCEGIAAKNELMDPDSPYKGSLAMFPEYFGRLCVLAARDLAEGKTLPSWIAPPITIITAENLSQYYTQNGDAWDPNWPEIEKLGYAERDVTELQ